MFPVRYGVDFSLRRGFLQIHFPSNESIRILVTTLADCCRKLGRAARIKIQRIVVEGDTGARFSNY
jgi:hypothetical protein